jgi:hypothetical protein
MRDFLPTYARHIVSLCAHIVSLCASVGKRIRWHGLQREINDLQRRFAHELSRDSRILRQFPPKVAHVLTISTKIAYSDKKAQNDIDSGMVARGEANRAKELHQRHHHQGSTPEGRRHRVREEPPFDLSVTTDLVELSPIVSSVRSFF